MPNNKKSLDTLIPTSIEKMNEAMQFLLQPDNDNMLSAYLSPEEMQNFINSRIVINKLKITKFEYVDFFEHFDPFNDPLPQNIHVEFYEIIKRIKPLVAHLTKQEINDILLAIALLTVNKPDFLTDKKLSSFRSLVTHKNHIELTHIFRLKKKIVWTELLAAHALFEVLIGILAWNSQHHEEFIKTPFGEFFSTLKFYDKIWLSIIIDSNSALTLAEDLENSRKNSSIGGKAINTLSPIKQKLKTAYFEKFSELPNRKAAIEILEELTAEEYMSFNSEYPNETIEKWIAKWKKENIKP